MANPRAPGSVSSPAAACWTLLWQKLAALPVPPPRPLVPLLASLEEGAQRGSPRGDRGTWRGCDTSWDPTSGTGLAVHRRRCPCQQPGRAPTCLARPSCPDRCPAICLPARRPKGSAASAPVPARCRAEEAEEGRGGHTPRLSPAPQQLLHPPRMLRACRRDGPLPCLQPGPLRGTSPLSALPASTLMYRNLMQFPDVGPSPANPLERRRHGKRQPRMRYPRQRSLPQRRPRQLLI